MGSSHPVPSFPLRGKILAPGGSLLVSVCLVLVVLAGGGGYLSKPSRLEGGVWQGQALGAKEDREGVVELAEGVGVGERPGQNTINQRHGPQPSLCYGKRVHPKETWEGNKTSD